MEHIQSQEILDASLFKERLASITNTPLSVENINSYADDALHQLIDLVDTFVSEYEQWPTITFQNKRDAEEAAFSYFGLNNLEAILDHIAKKADETKAIDSYIADITPMDITILPAGAGDVVITKADAESSFEKRELPRLKTLLFILNNEFKVDLTAPEEIEIKLGINEPTMVRSLSYFSVYLSQLERHVLISDEVGNITYVLNTAAYENGELTSETISALTKQELNAVIEKNPSYGKRVVYSDNYVANLIASIEDPTTTSKLSRNASEQPSFLLPEMPQNYVSIKEAAAILKVGTPVVKRTIDELQDSLGDVSEFRYKHGQIVKILSSEQLDLVREYIETNTQYGRRPPEDYLSNVGLAKHFNLSFQTIYKVTTAMQNQRIINPDTYLFSTTLTLGYSPDEQRAIEKYLLDNEYLIGPAPEGYLSINGLRTLVDASKRANGSIFKRVIVDLGDELGPIERHRFGQKVTDGFSPSQIRIILSKLEEDGYLLNSKPEGQGQLSNIIINRAPEGYIPMLTMAKQLGVSFSTAERIVNANEDEIGEVAIYKASGAATRCFSPEQQAIVREKLRKEGFYNKEAPAGFVTIAALKRRWNVWERLIRYQLSEHRDEIGEPTVYLVASRPEETWDERQQALLESYVREAGLIAPLPPEGVLNYNNLATKWGIDTTIVKKAIETASFENVLKYKFRTHVLPGYDAEQQNIIYKHLEVLGAFAPTMPDSYTTKKQLSEKAGGSVKKIERIMRDQSISGVRMKYNYQITVCLSPDDQATILKHW